MTVGRSTPYAFAVAVMAGVLLSGCAGETVGDALGVERRGPDAGNVVKRPPLIVPPDYNLRPPRSGETGEEEQGASERARSILTAGTAETTGTAGDADRLDLDRQSQTDAALSNDEAPHGQSLLLSRSNRVERDLEALIDTRPESPVDVALLRDMLDWEQEDDDGEAQVVVVRREQTVLSTASIAE